MVACGPTTLNALTIVNALVWYLPHVLYQQSYGSATGDAATVIPWWALFASLSSWFHAYTLVRSLANGQESLMLGLAVALVVPELLKSSRDQNDIVPKVHSKIALCAKDP
jgi:hypothetical protein